MDSNVNAQRVSRMSVVEPTPDDREDGPRGGLDDLLRAWEAGVSDLSRMASAPEHCGQVIAPGYREITGREREVLELLASGMSNAEIATRLLISTKTVDTHRGHLIKKLSLRNNSDLTWYAIRYGIVPLQRKEEESRLAAAAAR